jgi:hypothetical protein
MLIIKLALVAWPLIAIVRFFLKERQELKALHAAKCEQVALQEAEQERQVIYWRAKLDAQKVKVM